jgi:uncharacterized protein YhbP (UPF0306 family)
MNIAIQKFIQSEKVATLCCCDEDQNPYCFNCFYTFDSDNGLLIFKSSATSLHGKLMMKKPQVAGTILPAKLNVLFLKGVQIWGAISHNQGISSQEALKQYHKAFPFALAIPGEIFVMQIERIKMTDNGNGFGKKILWQRNDPRETTNDHVQLETENSQVFKKL